MTLLLIVVTFAEAQEARNKEKIFKKQQKTPQNSEISVTCHDIKDLSA